ncbi:uncharacterized protein LOC125851061 isoform X1 [Solanum stenotomum]|uniref:uncharacterized protein LOC125851061 isoform X1 n=1 Tax=Solanum stenotomum TaxID=172797 RepID=UPI0020D1E072|nr:uncharacterized protein LOC125851061 isoform X1 [Solanum stenotomum]
MYHDEIGQDDLSRKRSKQYHRNDDESKEGKLLRGILNNLEFKLNLLKARCTTKFDPTVFGVAESMKKNLGEILKMKDTHERCEDKIFSEENRETMTDAEIEKDDERKIDVIQRV